MNIDCSKILRFEVLELFAWLSGELCCMNCFKTVLRTFNV